MRALLFRLAEHADFVVVDEIFRGPAIEIVFSHALLCKLFQPHIGARSHRAEQSIASDLLMATTVVDLIKFMARAKFGPDSVPQELHKFYPPDCIDAAGA